MRTLVLVNEEDMILIIIRTGSSKPAPDGFLEVPQQYVGKLTLGYQLLKEAKDAAEKGAKS